MGHGWRSRNPNEISWLQIDLLIVYTIEAYQIEGTDEGFVSTIKFQFSNDTFSWIEDPSMTNMVR